MEERVVSSSLVMISPAPLQRLSKLKNRSTSIRISKVAANMLQLPADLHADLLRRPLFGLSQCKIGLPGDPPIGPGLLPGMESLVEVVYHPLQLLTGFMEEFEVLRVFDVGWGTGGIQNLCSDVLSSHCRLRIAFMFLRRRSGREEDVVDHHQGFCPEPFPERHQEGSRERAALPERFAPNEVLEIGVLTDLFYQPAVGQLLSLLDDEGPQRHAERLGRMSCLRREQLVVTGLLLHPAPVQPVAKKDPFVLRVKLHPAGLIEVCEGDLMKFRARVHGISSKKCKDT